MSLMLPTTSLAPAAGVDLEGALNVLELRLSALGEALRARDMQAVESNASELHRALSTAVHCFGQAARAGGVPPPLRRRLAQASGQVAAQRESLARATAALDRAIDVLMPDMAASTVYAANGHADRVHRGGLIEA